MTKEHFFTHEKSFYKNWFSMFLIVALQNLVAYSVNMADNIMLGNYSQEALSGAATVNQLFFLVQTFATSLGSALMTLTAQYWGKKKTDPIRTLTGIALRFALVSGIMIVAVCLLIPRPLLRIFTSSEAILDEGCAYLSIISWSFLLFILTTTLTSVLRSIGTVNISFYISVFSLVINVSINYVLIFGRFGLPRMGIRGAAVGTLIARILEFLIVLCYLLFGEKKIHFRSTKLFQKDRSLRRDFVRILIPGEISHMLWAVSVPAQTAILGHLSDDALAANSVATTFYQYLKVIVTAMASTSSVVIGNSIGEGGIDRVKSEARTLSVMDIGIGLVLGAVLLLLRRPLLTMYNLSDAAMELASNLIVIMSAVMVGMSYQMPISSGILAGGGDVRFTMVTNMISIWGIVIPLSLLAAFVWKLPVEIVVIFLQSDQFFKAIPCSVRLYRFRWIHRLTGQGNTV